MGLVRMQIQLVIWILLNKVLAENLEKKESIRTQTITISDMKDNPDDYEKAVRYRIPANILKVLYDRYSSEQINQLFNNVETPEQIDEAYEVLLTGFVKNNGSDFYVR